MYLIYLLLILTLLCLMAFYVIGKLWPYSDYDFIPGMCGVVLGVPFLGALGLIPIQHADVRSHMVAHEELRAMHLDANARSQFERTSWQVHIADSNTRIARHKYWAQNPWVSVYYPKAVLDVRPIR